MKFCWINLVASFCLLSETRPLRSSTKGANLAVGILYLISRLNVNLCKYFTNAGIYIDVHLSSVKGTVVATDIIIQKKVQYQRFLTYICYCAGRREVAGCALVCKCMRCSYCHREGCNSCLTHKRCSTPNAGKSCRIR